MTETQGIGEKELGVREEYSFVELDPNENQEDFDRIFGLAQGYRSLKEDKDNLSKMSWTNTPDEVDFIERKVLDIVRKYQDQRTPGLSAGDVRLAETDGAITRTSHGEMLVKTQHTHQGSQGDKTLLTRVLILRDPDNNGHKWYLVPDNLSVKRIVAEVKNPPEIPEKVLRKE